MNTPHCMIKTCKQMEYENIPLEIYYAEDMTEQGIRPTWSIDVMNNMVNDICHTAWSWTLISKTEDDEYCEEFDDDSLPEDYEIIVDELFSDEVVCDGIRTWLTENGIYNLKVVMIDFEAATPYSGYVKDLMSRNLDEEIKNAIPLEG